MEDVPNLASVLGAVLARLPAAEQPLLIAIAERLAADRYRGWADEPALASRRTELLACARREEDIAARVEALYPDAARIQEAILARNPDLLAINQELFAQGGLRRRLAIQAAGERLGAATWRALAGQDPDPARTAVFVACAGLEEESALVLEAILAAPAGG
jgi:hypothetical protein